LSGLPGAARVERQSAGDVGWDRWLVTPKPEAGDLRESIAAAVAGVGVTPRELSRRGATLEAVFLRVIESADAGGTVVTSGGAAA
jgi:hypothetical protein